MSKSYLERRRSRSRSPKGDAYAKRTSSMKINKIDLKRLIVRIRGASCTGADDDLPLERSLDDPTRVCSYIHYHQGKPSQPPIFKSSVKINQQLFGDDVLFTREASRSISRSRSRSPRYRSRSQNSEVTRSRRRSRSREEIRHLVNERAHRCSRRSRSLESEKPMHVRDHSPACPLYRRYSHERDHRIRSPTPLKPGEYRPSHPDKTLRYKRSRSREKGDELKRVGQNKKSSSGRNEQNLPSYSKDRSPRRSRSPRSPSRYDRRERGSKSPSRYKRSETRTRPVETSRYNRSKTPPRRRSRSRSPHYRSRREKSRSPARQSSSSHYKAHVEHIPPEFGYYEGGWFAPRLMPGPSPFPMPRFYPPGYYPRGIMAGPLIPPGPMPMPRIPRMNYGPYRHPLPVYNSRETKGTGNVGIVKHSAIEVSKDRSEGDSASEPVVSVIQGVPNSSGEAKSAKIGEESVGSSTDKNVEAQGTLQSEKK